DPGTGEIAEVRCTYDPETRGGFAPDGRKVEGTIHWVPAEQSIPAEVRLYDRLFQAANPMGGKEEGDFIKFLNPRSMEVVKSCRVEPSVAGAAPGTRYQFERLGYFCVDSDSSEGDLVFNRTVTLRDSWAKISSAGKGQK
ncbi:MAG TPA: glutamine--tRNA ligase, partial [Thermodesulfobacteriota bacterium]|nr:glutamine--tRNA ligase [Thermodesulfobacteriota bacterium]